MGPIDQKFKKEVKGERSPSRSRTSSPNGKEDREIEGGEPDLGEVEEDPSGR